ncbi:MAG: hypothetical protein V4736_11720 [Bdellovibrionota bacterium]
MSDSHKHGHSEVHARQAEEKRIFREMIPFFFYALIPIAITITIAMVFGNTSQY